MCIFLAAAMKGGAMCVVIVIADLQVVRQHIPAADMRAAVAVGMEAAAASGEPHKLIAQKQT
jgi:hypothetical protein